MLICSIISLNNLPTRRIIPVDNHILNKNKSLNNSSDFNNTKKLN